MIRPIKIGYRAYQLIMRLGSYFLDFRSPRLLEGPGSLRRLPELIRSMGIHKVLVVSDKGLVALGLLDDLLRGLSRESVDFVLYDAAQANPTIANIEGARQFYTAGGCEAIVAVGGGSPLDCAKAAGARISNPGRSVQQLRGQLKVKRRPPLLFAVPTTAGTGSEATVAAVVTDPSTHEKYAINDPKLIPAYAVLDPELTVGLPPHITSTTGMDALTHAVEAYIGRSNTKATSELSENAVELIFGNIERAYRTGKDIEARANMLLAAHYAGIAFTRAYVGYVHAIAHCVGGLYGVPHGLANAVILPYVLEYYGESVAAPLARLSDRIGLAGSATTRSRKAAMFVEAVKELNARLGIPSSIPEIQEKDVPLIVNRVLKEANPLYPVPTIMTSRDCEALVCRLMIRVLPRDPR